MARLSTDLNLRKRLIAAGAERARPLTWRRCAQETVQVLEKIATARRPTDIM
jgi:hypothetical protein